MEFGISISVLNVADNEAFGMRGQQKLHDAKTRFGAHGGEHVGVTSDLVEIGFGWRLHISIFAEIGKYVKGRKEAGELKVAPTKDKSKTTLPAARDDIGTRRSRREGKSRSFGDAFLKSRRGPAAERAPSAAHSMCAKDRIASRMTTWAASAAQT